MASSTIRPLDRPSPHAPTPEELRAQQACEDAWAEEFVGRALCMPEPVLPRMGLLSRTQIVHVGWHRLVHHMARMACRAFPHLSLDQRQQGVLMLDTLRHHQTGPHEPYWILEAMDPVWPLWLALSAEDAAEFVSHIMPTLLSLLAESVDAVASTPAGPSSSAKTVEIPSTSRDGPPPSAAQAAM
jgi:hypothetical protein